MSVNKDYCMSSYLAFRYIEDPDKDFYEHMHHIIKPLPDDAERVLVSNADEIDHELKKSFEKLSGKKLGIMLSGGMDSAVLSAYMPKGSFAYTFRFMNGDYDPDELKRAEQFAKASGLEIKYVDIDFEKIKNALPNVMKTKCAPVHSIEPQLYIAALQAKADGIDCLVIGDAADYVFYGMDGLLAKEWSFDDYVKRATYIMPEDVLCNPCDITYVYERYRTGEGIDYLKFYDKCITEESYDSYDNAFGSANIPYVDPYEILKLKGGVDLNKIRSGNSKYYIRELFRLKFPNIPLPEKHPMPRPVDLYFKDWEGPKRKEFRSDIDIQNYSGNQKWLLWCLEQFLNEYEK